jgi:hypothetical protein
MYHDFASFDTTTYLGLLFRHPSNSPMHLRRSRNLAVSGIGKLSFSSRGGRTSAPFEAGWSYTLTPQSQGMSSSSSCMVICYCCNIFRMFIIQRVVLGEMGWPRSNDVSVKLYHDIKGSWKTVGHTWNVHFYHVCY